MWEELPAHEPSVDDQVTKFVEQNGVIIVHPGQIAIHTDWHDDEFTLKQVTYGLTILYAYPAQGASDAERNRSRQEAAACACGTDGAESEATGAGAIAVSSSTERRGPSDTSLASGPADASVAEPTIRPSIIITGAVEYPPIPPTAADPDTGSGGRDSGGPTGSRHKRAGAAIDLF